MYHHVKKLMFTVRGDEPDPRFGNMLLEQFGGANGELAAAMQYSIQGLNCEDPDRKDLLMDIGTEELSHSKSWDAWRGCILNHPNSIVWPLRPTR
jgi:Mn-containing catalase